VTPIRARGERNYFHAVIATEVPSKRLVYEQRLRQGAGSASTRTMVRGVVRTRAPI